MYNVAIIGAGPAGIFAALEITKLKPDWKVVLIEKGQKLKTENACLEKATKNARHAKDAVCSADGAAQEHFLTGN